DGLDRADSRGKRNGEGFVSAGDSRAIAAIGKTVCCGELRGAAGNTDRVGAIWLRTRGIYGRGATEKREVRTGVGGNDFSGRNRGHESSDTGESASRAGKPHDRTIGRNTIDSGGRARDQCNPPQPGGGNSQRQVSRGLVLPAAGSDAGTGPVARAQSGYRV